MPNISDAYEAMTILQTHLQSRLVDDFSSTFASYGGARVILEDDEPDTPDQVGCPYIVLSLANDRSSEFGRCARDVSITAETVATEFSGAQTGVSNPVGSDTLLSKALREIIKDDYAILRDLGLLMCAIRTEKERNQDGTHTNPHVITTTIRTE